MNDVDSVLFVAARLIYNIVQFVFAEAEFLFSVL